MTHGRRRSRAVARLLAVLSVLVLSACGDESAHSLISSGKRYAASGDLRAATIQFKSALRLDGQSIQARMLLGQALMDAGDPANAALELEKALTQQAPRNTVLPQLLRALVLSGEAKRVVNMYAGETLDDPLGQASAKTSLATAWLALGDKGKAQTALQQALQSKDDFAAALVLQARLVASQGDLTSAQVLIDRATAGSGSGRAEAWALSGDLINARNGDPAQAEAAYLKSLELDARQLSAHAGLITSRLRADDLDGAKRRADALRAKWPKHPMTTFVDAQIAFQQRDFARARERVQVLLKAVPDHVGALQLAGAVEGETGSIFMAESYLAKALQIAPELVHLRRNLARVLNRQGQPARALATLAPLIGPDSADSEALTLAGEAELKRERPFEAESYFNRAARIAPDDERTLTLLAMSHFARGNADAGFAELEDVARKGKALYAERAIVSARLKRRQFDAALAAVDAIERKTSKSAATAELRGRIELARPDWVAARAAFEQAAMLDPALFAATASLARIDIAQGKFDTARKRLEAAVNADARNHLALMALADLSQRRDENVDATKALLQRAVQAAPDAPEPRFKQIEFLIQKRLLQETLTAAQEATAALPHDLRVLDVVGQAQMAAGDTEQAINSFRRLAALDAASPTAYIRLADLFKATGQQEQAEVALKKALEIAPENVGAQASLLALLALSGRTGDALNYAQSLQRRAPSAVGGYLAEAAFHRYMKAPQAALAAYRRGVQETRDAMLMRVMYDYLLEQSRRRDAVAVSAAWERDHAYDADNDMQLAAIDIRHREFAAAETRLTRIVKAQPKNLAALNNLAWLLAKRGSVDGVAYARRATELTPNNVAVLDTLALALAAASQFDEALAVQKRALELSPAGHDLRLTLATVALMAGRKDLARSELDRLRALGPGYARQIEVSKLAMEL